ncbi:hypothetical protein WICMUC_000909 [Wickerhamomyces mucosus]|uniref:Uncharacterized protein n=1 Tax=Wickerhamomyces mucosus TaxID=1378264 RepID=A0A9P8TI10_9ASCO|nr:hypothetical protein WICMUC_000909 [Wickerhamomyces mucosus]
MVPTLDESSGLVSNNSTPSNLANNSNLSKPVACSRSVGKVFSLAPAPIKVSEPLTSSNDLAVLYVGFADCNKIDLCENDLID